jgi:hypothetical protein
MMWRQRFGLRAAAARWSLAVAVLCAVCFSATACVANEQDSPSDQQPSAASAKACPAFRIRPQDQLWAVSTRHLGCGCSPSQEPAWKMWRYDHASQQWIVSRAADFYATDSADVVTTFYIHGNRIDHSQAFKDGQDVYFQLAGKSDDERPVRFVIWSWPSSQIKGPLKDIRSKAWRTDIDGYYLARFVAGISPEAPTGLIGYSYGARIITGALHVLGGGALAGQTVPPGDQPPLRVALWAAALHDHWLLPGHYHGNALGQADRWLITHNCCDPVLSRYQWIEKCGNPVAMGYSGVYGRNLLPPDLNDRIEELNVTCLVGGTHDMRPYLYSLPILNRTREYVLWHELDAARPAAPALAAAAAN